MSDQTLRILQVNTEDQGGGAEKGAWNLFQAVRERGHKSWLAVGHKRGDDPDVLPIPNDRRRGLWSRFWLEKLRNAEQGIEQSNGKAGHLHLLNILAEPKRALDQYRGIEDFHFPGTWELLKLTLEPPDILHCHNLHGGYFDLRALPWLSHQVPLVLTLHDAWLLSGHCAHSFACERWKLGCGRCPDLSIEPSVPRDATAYNWKRKQAIYKQSQIYLSTPSEWLMQKVKQSMLVPAVIEARVIPNGVDLSTFHPSDKQTVRSELNIPRDALVLLFVANNVRSNTWKDYPTIRTAMALVAEWLQDQAVRFICLGEDAPVERVGRVELQFVPYQRDSTTVARYYQAADLYVHAANADTFPNTILEALACGAPIVATAVGGISEQIREGHTGYLTPAGNPQTMASRIIELLSNESHRKTMSKEAAEDARRRFGLQSQVDAYLKWYQEIIYQEATRLSLERI